MNRHLTTVFFLLLTIQLYGQDWSGNSITFLKDDGSTGGDNTFFKRFDTINDRTLLRLNLGDENSSNFEIGYHHYNGSGWYTNFSLDGYGNGYFKGSLGIGTTSPDAKLDIEGSEELIRLTYGNTAGYLRGYKNGSQHWYVGAGSNGTDNIYLANYRNASLNLLTNSQYRLTILGDGNVGIGETNPTKKLVVNGVIGATEVKVSTTPNSDFVFEPDYNLLPLHEVDSFIQQNKHLPDIPSAEEFKEKGVGLGEMDDMLLRKIEELTLYVIELKKSDDLKHKLIQDLEKENEELRVSNLELKAENQTIKSDLLTEIEIIKTRLK